MKLRPYQTEGVSALVQYFIDGNTGNPIAVYPTACHAKGHMILMFDGSTKPVENVVVGDLLMGDDSTPREVLELHRGRQEMRRVVPKIGEPFVVNLDHKLSVYVTPQNANPHFESEKAKIETITIRRYEEGTRWYRHVRKMRRAEYLEFPAKEQPLHPYLIGILLGDGSMVNHAVSLTTADDEIADWFIDELSKLDMEVRIARKSDNKAASYYASYRHSTRSVPSPLTKRLRDIGMMDLRGWDKHIPYIYKTGDREQRLALLAGLIDSDGYVEGTGVEYTTASKQLGKDVQFLARSLGFSASIVERETFLYGVKKRNSFRVYINGDFTAVPFIRKRHIEKAQHKLQRKSRYITGFTLEKLPEDDYYGFSLSGNKLYLDENLVVHHNSGKSVIIAELVKYIMSYPNQKVLMLTHRKELIAQNYEKLITVWPTAPAGIYSAGLGKREAMNPITFAGIASVSGKHALFGRIDIILIDECQLVSVDAETMYRAFINELKAVNPYLKVIGFTATPWRIGQGKLTDEGGLFTDIAIDYSSLDKFNWLISEGYLSPLIPNRTTLNIDTENLHIRGGEFITSEVQKAVDKNEITIAALKETLEVASERKCGMIFGAGIEHCEHIEAALKAMGQSCCVVHSKQDNKINDQYIADFKAGKIRWLINNDKLTTGFDCPQVDVIVVLRPTASIVLWVQMLGRGCRVVYAPGFDLETKEGRLSAIAAGPKQNCLVLDFANNTRRLGPINDPVIPRKRGKGGGTAPIKECMYCPTINHASARFCIACGEEFLFQTKIVEQSSAEELIKGEIPIIETFNVSHVTYRINIGVRGKAPTLLVSYHCGYSLYKEYICLEHEKPAVKAKARSWWRESGGQVPEPATIEEAVLRKGELSAPKSIRVWVNKQYPEILARFFT